MQVKGKLTPLYDYVLVKSKERALGTSSPNLIDSKLPTLMASTLVAMASNLEAMACNLLAMASTLVVVASTTASNLEGMASNLLALGTSSPFEPTWSLLGEPTESCRKRSTSSLQS